MMQKINEVFLNSTLPKAMLVLFVSGSLTALSLSPLYLWPLSLFFTSLLLISPNNYGFAKNLWLGWSFGFGYFTVGLYWISNALFVDIEKFWWLLPFSLFGLPLILAFFTAIPNFLVVIFRLKGITRISGLVVFWVFAEYLRAHLFTGFPWNIIGYNLCFSDSMIQVASIFGVYGLSFLTLLPAWSSACWLMERKIWPAILSIIVIISSVIFGIIRLDSPTIYHDDMWMRMVQPSIPQTLKWDPEERENNFYKLISLSQQTSKHKLKAIIWPETAIPFFLDRDVIHREVMQNILSKDAFFILGAPRRTPDYQEPVEVWNSILVMDKAGEIVNHYDKSHLVPFGEYMPFRKVLEGYISVNKITAGSIDFSAGSGPRKITIDSIPPFAGLVCYESIFPGEVTPKGKDRPEWLLNVTNDAWYGNSSGPYQHLEISRMRAVEEGMPMVRCANNGISAVFDAYGREIAHLDLMEVGFEDFQLPKALAQVTIYGQYGDKTIILLMIFLTLCCFLVNNRNKTK